MEGQMLISHMSFDPDALTAPIAQSARISFHATVDDATFVQ